VAHARRWFQRAPGVLLRPLGEGWVAYSTLSGETHVLNVESVAVIEALDETKPLDDATLATMLADDCGLPAEQLLNTLEASWPPLLDAGLVREHPSHGAC
jgi:PqqD family protein of HPr-rel-A system